MTTLAVLWPTPGSFSNSSNVFGTLPEWFSINNFDRNILITAKEGDFINKDKILLKKNVLFKSNKFSIESDNVIFNRKDQTAESYENSIFRSNNTKISSEGFNIYDSGNKIKFHGNSIIILKWRFF